VSHAGAFPQGYISQVESAAVCKESGKRLCTKNEWTHACCGKGFTLYPYGNQSVHGKCNSGKTHLLSQMFKDPPGGWKHDEHFNSPELNKTPGWLAKAGEYSDCKSELGVYDMVGNLASG
jgi:sulfatase modifying factor 1